MPSSKFVFGFPAHCQWQPKAAVTAVASLAMDTSLGQTGDAVDPGATNLNPDPQAAARTARSSRRAAVGTATAFGSKAALGLVSKYFENFKLSLKTRRILIFFWVNSPPRLMTIINCASLQAAGALFLLRRRRIPRLVAVGSPTPSPGVTDSVPVPIATDKQIRSSGNRGSVPVATGHDRALQ